MYTFLDFRYILQNVAISGYLHIVCDGVNMQGIHGLLFSEDSKLESIKFISRIEISMELKVAGSNSIFCFNILDILKQKFNLSTTGDRNINYSLI